MSFEQPISRESFPSINYLNENVRVSFSIEPEAVRYLPKISNEELESHKEQYVVLLGTKNISDPFNVSLHIKSILQIPETEQKERRYYKEGIESIEELDIRAIRQLVDNLKSVSPEHKNDIFIGDIHTHPVKPSERGGVIAISPSDKDIEEIVRSYEEDEINPKEPYVFAIAAPDEAGETTYAFYRLVKTEDGYKAKHLD